MAYAIGEACVDVMDRYCVEECPVDAIYEGRRKLYIQPDECIDCGACLEVCPTGAPVVVTADLSPDSIAGQEALFFTAPLPGREAAIGSPGGAATLGPLDVDTGAVTEFSA